MLRLASRLLCGRGARAVSSAMWIRVVQALWRPVAAAAAVLIAYWRGRAEGAAAAEMRARRAEDQTRRRASDAADAYRRDGAAERLRRGEF